MKRPFRLLTLCLTILWTLGYLMASQGVSPPNALAAGRAKKFRTASPLRLSPAGSASKVSSAQEPQLEPILPPLEGTTPIEATMPTRTPELSPLPDIHKKIVPAIQRETGVNPATPKPMAAYSTLPKVTLLLNGENFSVEVAQKLEDQLRGLMFRESLPPKTGMMFLFTPPRAVNFWMKNCKVSLDMVFIRNNTVVNTAENAIPCIKDPCPVYGSIYAVDTVVELPAGSVKQFAIQPGDKMILTKNPSTTAYNTGTGYAPEKMPVEKNQNTPPPSQVPEMQPELSTPTNR
jgi:uncharacterized membrane protein (UPF0127 family)